MIKWMSIPEYSKKTGLGRGVIVKMIESGELIATTTEGGGQLRIKAESDPELDRLNEQVTEMNNRLEMLCNHLGLKTSNNKYF